MSQLTMTKTINAIIIDDERMARQELLRLFKQHPCIQVVAQAENIDQGLEQIELQQVDVIFLDIEMPGGTGLQLAEQLQGKYPIVFCTAYDEFAVDAFGLNAIDYLVKPIIPERLSQAIGRLTKVEQAISQEPLDDDFKLMVKFAENMRIIRLGDIVRFESIGNHAAIYTAHGKAYLHSSLNKIEARLNSNSYFRASRVDILRIDAIEKLEQNINYGFTAQLINKSEVEISRRQATKLKAQLGFPVI
ncbi:response regulator transcription factor [Colwellia sp. MB3u-70]|nr:response regulator transcription factor [Colwellia sp. MB3u-8]MBA6309154.1 response regulator transcription factor [Colwellia sp. MB3u-70]